MTSNDNVNFRPLYVLKARAKFLPYISASRFRVHKSDREECTERGIAIGVGNSPRCIHY